MDNYLIAMASISINAPVGKVWDALVNPEAIRVYFFGTNVVSEWRKGSSIVWKGEWEGKPYQDKGVILQFDPGKTIQYSHFSPLSGLPDDPENYHTVTIKLAAVEDHTTVVLSQDRNATEEERAHSEANWGMMLTALKKYLEQ